MFKKLIDAYHQYRLEITDPHELINLKFITPEMVDKGLDNPDPIIRWHWAQHNID